MSLKKRCSYLLVITILILTLLTPVFFLVETNIEASTPTPEPVHYNGQYCQGNIPFAIEINEGDRITMEIIAGLYNLGVQFKDPFGAVIWDKRIGHYNGQYIAKTTGTHYLVIYMAYGLGCSNYELTYTIFPLQTHTWPFCNAGFFPKHLPDSYIGQVALADLDLGTISGEMQGIYWYDCSTLEWKFWAPGAPGCTLSTLGGGHTYDYMVAVTGDCEWEIALP